MSADLTGVIRMPLAVRQGGAMALKPPPVGIHPPGNEPSRTDGLMTAPPDIGRPSSTMWPDTAAAGQGELLVTPLVYIVRVY